MVKVDVLHVISHHSVSLFDQRREKKTRQLILEGKESQFSYVGRSCCFFFFVLLFFCLVFVVSVLFMFYLFEIKLQCCEKIWVSFEIKPSSLVIMFLV